MATHAARFGDLHTCPKVSKLQVPHVGGPTIGRAPVQVFAGGSPALRLGDFASCTGSMDIVIEGAAEVLVEGMPWAACGHKTAHGGVITGGLVTVILGGPTFSLPPNVEVEGPIEFKNRVLRDLFDLWTWPGRALFDGLGRLGVPVKLVPEEGCVAWTHVSEGEPGSGVVVGYPSEPPSGGNPQDECFIHSPHSRFAHDWVQRLLALGSDTPEAPPR